MTNPVIDNSADVGLNKTIIWQYDNSANIVGIVEMLKDFFNQSTGGLWDRIATSLNISSPEQADDFGLTIWSNLLGVPRPIIDTDTISTELFRRIIVARLRLAMSNASAKSFCDFVDYIFDGNVSVTDGQNMSISFSWIGEDEPQDELIAEMKRLFDYDSERTASGFQSMIFSYPSGIRTSISANSPIFGFSGQNPKAEGDLNIGKLDECGLVWKNK